MQTPKTQFFFERTKQVEPCEFSSLLQVFHVNTMGSFGLRQYCDSLQILFYGYAGEKRLPFVIPEMRVFLRKLRKKWPFAPWFCDLGNSFISLEAMAHIDHFSVIERMESDEIYFRVNTAELQSYVRESHHLIRKLGQEAGMPSAEIRRRRENFDVYIRQRLGPAEW
ncbi:MAG: hypothetical protein ACTHLW_01045 [Verrucomicrobiota bacterium]